MANYIDLKRKGHSAMRLELNILKIRDVKFADRTAVFDGVLYINRHQLQELLLEDRRLTQVDVTLAHPGEKCRILKVMDVIEPRAKTSNGDEDFPGAVGKQVPAGRGTTCVLKGTAVVISDYSGLGESPSTDPNGEIIDMFGQGAEISSYGKTHNIVLLATPADGVSIQEYRVAVKIAGLKMSAYLAKAGKGIRADETEVFELPRLGDVSESSQKLPRVVYIFQILTLQYEPILGEPVLYGKNVPDIVPTLIHPNEVFDGAVIAPHHALLVQTYHIQNHPIIKQLYQKDGKELFFAGVIIMTAPNNITDIERVSNIASCLAKYSLRADGAVLTKIGGGAPELTMARTAQRCEQLGVKTAIAMLHLGADIKDTKYGGVTIFSMPEVDAIVSMGVPFVKFTLPAVDRIIGWSPLSQGELPIQGEMVRTLRWVNGSLCQLGSTKEKAVRY
jgi:sarcosine reductase